MSLVRPDRRRFAHVLKRVLLASSILLVGALAIELMLRSRVPNNGTTPFQQGSADGNAYSLRPSFQTEYKGATVRTNRLGLRNDEIPPAKGRERRIVLVGDSVTFGAGVEQDQTLAVFLERELAAAGHATRVINFGIPGYSAENVERCVERRVLELEPDFVVYVFVFNDVILNTMSGEVDPAAVIDEFKEFPLGSALLQFLGVRVRALLRSIGDQESGAWVQLVLQCAKEGGEERVDHAIARCAELCSARGVHFVVANFPYMITPARDPFASVVRFAADRCRARGVDFVDLVAAFAPDENLGRLWANPFDAHPNGEAHARAAKVLAAALIAQGGWK